MIKLIGAVLVLVSAYAIGSMFALRIKEQERWLKEIKTTLFLLQGELDYRQVPLPEAAAAAGKRCDGRLSPFFRNLAEELQKKEEGSLQEIWKQQAEIAVKDCPLSAGQKEEFAELGLIFTDSDRTTRKNSLEFYFQRLEEDIVKSRKNGADRAYLCRTLGMMGGILILILAL